MKIKLRKQRVSSGIEYGTKAYRYELPQLGMFNAESGCIPPPWSLIAAEY